MSKLEEFLEKIIFAGRWLLAPLYIGLLAALLPILYRFFHSFWHMISHISSLTAGEITLQVLELLDTVLLGNLIIIILFAGYENFVSKIKVAEGAEDRPHWMGHVDYSGLKIKLIGSLVAISVIELLKDFMQEGAFDANREGWRIGIHVTFVISGVLFAYMDNLADRHKSER
jgi:uncharacterized protein (TIGR00645 family)